MILVYTLALVCNVLLVNLLIAVMNSTYEKNQAGISDHIVYYIHHINIFYYVISYYTI